MSVVLKAGRGGNVRNQRCTHSKKVARQQRADDRQLALEKVTPTQRLERLDAAFGKGVGAQKERAKLAKLVEQNQKSNQKQEKVA